MNINFRVIKALVKRDLRLYFSNPNGYVFITLFIFLSAAAAFWQGRFFLNNLANLDQLNSLFPYLLLFFVPAITMGVWADERRQGTEELLLTLPAADFEVAIGKYISTVGIYTAALVLSLSHVVVLFWLGRPDLGLMISNYFGYCLIGSTFIAVGMLASLLSPNVTVAFILGAIFCSLFIFIEPIFGVFGKGAEDPARAIAVFPHFGDFSRGVITFSGLVYFLSIIVVMLYINVILLGRRHWPPQADGYKMWVHAMVRVVAVGVAVIALNVMFGRSSLRVDATAERLHSLSRETRTLLRQLPEDRPVFIQAFVSRDVPREYVQTRANLLGFLREIDSMAGSKVQVIINETEPYTDEAREAREKFGIVPAQLPEVGSGGATQVFMGVAFTSGAEEDVIPFFDRGLPTEYELVRSIRVVARTQRRKIGVLTTQAKVFGGFDFNTFASQASWPIVEELKKQYEVIQIAPTDSISGELDGMLVVLPSSLAQDEMDRLQTYILAGNPTMLLVDPVTLFDLGLSPSEASGANVNPFMRNRGPQPKPKGDINAFMTRLGIAWNNTQVVWDGYNPHPELASLPPEVVFVGPGNGNRNSFNRNFLASAGLQELVMLFPGTITPAPGSSYTFEPLVRSGTAAGSVNYGQIVRKDFFGIQLAAQGAPHYPTGGDYPLAARVYSDAADTTGVTAPLDLIVITDIDFVGDQFFQIRQRGFENLNFDNVSFFLNCMDLLVGDDSFVALRNRRVKHRTLGRVEARTRAYAEQRAREEQEASMEAQQALGEAQGRLNEKINEVRQRTDLDEQTKQIMARNLQEVENRRLETLKMNIEAERDAKIASSRENMESQVRSIQSNIKTLAGILPPIPVFLLGIAVFVRRRNKEKEGAAAVRRLRG